MPELSRREFLRVSSLVALGSIAAACGPGAPAVPPADEPGTAPEPGLPAPGAPPTPEPGTLTRFNEAPMLADLVAQGQLPPVDERLPDNPYVAPVAEMIGNYGGTIRRGFNGVADRWGPTKVQETSLAWYNYDLTLHPALAESWEMNEDASEWTWHLRPGTRWSDGEPFTTEAFTWYWEYQLENETLTPVYPGTLSWGEPRQLAELDTPDDFTVIIRFGEPNPLHPYHWVRGQPFNAGHYMSRYHIDTTEDQATLDAELATSGMSTWDQFFEDRNNWFMNPEKPSVNPWVAENQLSSELFLMIRNPYHYKVDPEGNQLPYVDRVNHRLFETPEVLNLWIVNGDIDFQNRHVSIANFTLFRENEQSGDYRVFRGISSNHFTVQLNLSTPNPQLREFFQSRNVRLALSYAVNRDDLNELAYDGLATPRQYSPIEPSPNYYPTLSYAHIEYDPDLANQLLDEAGYNQRGGDGFRQHPDGSPLSFIIEGTAAAGSPDEDAIQLVVRYYADVGVRATYRFVDRSLYEEHYNANDIEAASWGGDRTVLPINAPGIFDGTIVDRPWAGAWGHWRGNPNNPVAERPPDDHWIWDIWNLIDEIEVEPDEARRNELFQQVLDIWAEELPMIGYLGQFPALIIVKNGLRNYLEGFPIDDPLKDEHLLSTETYFWENPDQHT